MTMTSPKPTKAKSAAKIHRTKLPHRWAERLVLDDGRTLWLRPIEPADAEPIQQTFPLLSAEEVRLRFLHPIKALSPELIHHLTTIDPATQFALVVAEPLPPGDALVGAVARLAIDGDTRQAEFAIIVSRFLARKGLGRLLMKRLIHWAKLKRLDSIYGDVLDENRAMLGLARSLGFRHDPIQEEPGIIRVRLDLKTAAR